METVGNVLTILGGVVFFSSALMKKPGVPFASLNPKHWKPMWHPKVKESFRPPGYVMMWLGFGVFAIGQALKWLPRWLG
ncbi:MAG TPA: hypothetical protein VGB22_10905 [candidate division Zixibacteria bacterium]|jgi:hypothetical protein